MECPNCHHQANPSSLVRCSSCGKTFERQILEEYEHIQYLLRWLKAHRESVGKNADSLLVDLTNQRASLLTKMQWSVPATQAKPQKAGTAPSIIEPVASSTAKPLTVDEIKPKPVPAAIPSQTAPSASTLTSAPIPTLTLPTPAPAARHQPIPTPLKPAESPKPVPPPKPARPPVNWGKIWDNSVNFVVSGALLRALLYMGAFMIVVSAAVLVINFWNIIPPILQVAFIFALPTAFYVGGWLTRTRLQLAQAGTVLTGIGAILLAVDFAALYQFSHLTFEINQYWLFASLVTTALYIFTAYRISGEFFDYLMYISSISILLALTRVMQAPLEWTIATIPFAGAGMVALAIRLWSRGERWREMAHAARYLPQVLMPISLAVILFVGGPSSQPGKMIAFLCAAAAYGLLAWKFPSRGQLLAALVNLTVAVGFGVLFFDSTGMWLPTVGTLLAAGYILTGRAIFQDSVERVPPGKIVVGGLADGGEIQVEQPGKVNPYKDFRQIFHASGLVLSLAAFIASLRLLALGSQLEAAVPLTVLALSFCAWNLLLRQPLFGFIGAGLLFVPLWLWLDLAKVIEFGFYPLAYLLLISFAHYPFGIFVHRIDRKLAQPFEWFGWLGSGVIFLLACFAPVAQSPTWAPALTLTLLTVYYIFNGWHFRHSVFASADALAIPAAVFSWLNVWKVPLDQAALVWAGLAFVYLFIERFLSGLMVSSAAGERVSSVWAKRVFRLPFELGTIILALVALYISIIAYNQFFINLNRVGLTLAAQAMLVLLTILAARLHRSRLPLFIEPFLSSLLAVLFFLVFSPSLLGYPLEWFQYGLVFCTVAWLHLLVAAGLDASSTRYSHGLYLGGYALSVLAVLLSITSRSIWLWTQAGFLIAMIASASLVQINRHHTWGDFAGRFGAKDKPFVRLVRSAFHWPVAWLFPIWCALLFKELGIPDAFCWLGLGLPALIYSFLGEQLAKRDAAYSWPFFSAAHLFVLVALIFNVDIILSEISRIAFNPSGLFVAAGSAQITLGQGLVQFVSVVFYVIWAWKKRQRVFALIAAWLSILPFTSLLVILGNISYSQIVIAWAGWAGLLLVTGFLLDRLPEASPRWAHGVYLGGYSLAVCSLLISLQLRWLNIVVLGILIVFSALSSISVQFKRHRTWNDFSSLFGVPGTTLFRLVRGAFLWPVAWLFPLWGAQILIYLEISYAFRWLAFSIPALLYLALGKWLSKHEPTYSWSFFSAAHVTIPIALFFSVNTVLAASSRIIGDLLFTPNLADALQSITGQGLVQLGTVAFYIAWAWMNRQRVFAHLSAWLSILPFTSLLLSSQRLTSEQIVISWMSWAIVLMLTGLYLDRKPEAFPRHAHGPYLAGYLLAVLALLISTQDRMINIIVLGMCILSAAFSFVLVHFKQHRSFDDFTGFFWRKDTLIRRGIRLLPLFIAVYAMPVWMLQLEAYYHLSLAWQGVSLALLAPLLIAAGLLLRRFNSDYTWPFYSAGYALTALGAMISFGDVHLAIYVLTLDVVVYAVSAVIFRQPFWLYLATCLAPITVLVTLQYNEHLTSQWVAWAFSIIGFLYFGLGQLLDRRKEISTSIAPFAMPLYVPGYLLSAIALALASSDRSLALEVYPVNILLYALSAWRFREALFLYPVAWLSIVPYYLFVTTYFTVPFEWQGLAWLPLILTFIVLGRFVFHKSPLNMKSPRAIFASLTHPAIPFYAIAYALTVTMILGSRWIPTPLTIALATATILYLASALMFRHPAWLYPTLFTAHLAILAYFSIHPTDNPARFITYPFLVLTWLEALAGYFVSRRYPVTEMAANGRVVFKFFGYYQFDFGSFPSIGYLAVPSWAQPIFIVVALDTLLWESLALSGLDTGVWVSAGFFLLFALFATVWQDQLLAYLALGFGTVTFLIQLHVGGMSIPQIFAGLSGIALILYLLSWLAEWLKGLLSVWQRPLVNIAMFLSVLGLVVTLPAVFSDSIPAALALGCSGGLYLTMSLRRRTYLLGYLGMGLLLAGWSLLLFKQNVSEPQFYALPAGFYFAAMGFLERLRRPGRFALLIESLGLALLLVTSFVQSIDTVNGFPYFLLLLVEGFAVVWWGAVRHLRVPFFIGIIASVMNILAQVVVLVRVYEVNRWIIIFGVGILIVGLGLFMERRREMLITRSQEFRDMLERWD